MMPEKWKCLINTRHFHLEVNVFLPNSHFTSLEFLNLLIKYIHTWHIYYFISDVTNLQRKNFTEQLISNCNQNLK
jgi:hypothetical protein